MTFKYMLKCTPKRFVKFIIVCVSIIGLVIYFPRKPTEQKLYKVRPLDFIDPDAQLKRDPGLVHFTPRPVSINPNRYSKTGTIRFNHTCNARLKVGQMDTPICVYGRNLDHMVSAFVKDHGTWEKEQLEIMEIILKQNKNMQVVDLGCNIGVYTLYAAKMGRKVIAVDALETNLLLLRKSLEHGKLTGKVTLVHNAIADRSQKMVIDLRIGNIGGTHINARKGQDSSHKRVKRNKELLKPVKMLTREARHKRVKRYKRLFKIPHKIESFDVPHKRVKRYKRVHQHPPKAHKLMKKSASTLKTNRPLDLNAPRPKASVKQMTASPDKKNLKTFKLTKTNDMDIDKFLPGKRVAPKIPKAPPPREQNLKIANKLQNPIKLKGDQLKIKEVLKNQKVIDVKLRDVKAKPKSEKHKSVKAQDIPRSDNSDVLKQNRATVQAVTLDDLVKLGSFKPTFLKIDIEGGEHLALSKASIFLNEFDVRFIMMEWTNLRRSNDGKKVMNYLVKNGFLPHKNSKKDEFLDINRSSAWPDNVLWRKR